MKLDAALHLWMNVPSLSTGKSAKIAADEIYHFFASSVN